MAFCVRQGPAAFRIGLCAAVLQACAAAPTARSDGDADSDDGWTGRTNVEAVFATSCSGCHGAQWSTCWDVQQSATSVQDAITSGDMPRGSALSPSDKNSVVSWLQQGAPCSGANPEGPDAAPGQGGPPVVGIAESATVGRVP
jgi:mono/diheme cytochrome c family protein